MGLFVNRQAAAQLARKQKWEELEKAVGECLACPHVVRIATSSLVNPLLNFSESSPSTLDGPHYI